MKDAGKIEQNELNFAFGEDEPVDDDDVGDGDFWGVGSDPKKFKLFKGFGRVLKVTKPCPCGQGKTVAKAICGQRCPLPQRSRRGQ